MLQHSGVWILSIHLQAVNSILYSQALIHFFMYKKSEGDFFKARFERRTFALLHFHLDSGFWQYLQHCKMHEKGHMWCLLDWIKTNSTHSDVLHSQNLFVFNAEKCNYSINVCTYRQICNWIGELKKVTLPLTPTFQERQKPSHCQNMKINFIWQSTLIHSHSQRLQF